MKFSETFTNQDVREKRVLAYATGGELSQGVVLESSLGDDFTIVEPMTGKTITGKKYVAGQLIAPCLTTAGGGKVGRYAKYLGGTNTDGRGNVSSVAPSSLAVLERDIVVTFGDVPASAFTDFCAFDYPQLTGYTGNEVAVKARMTRCVFTAITRLDA